MQLQNWVSTHCDGAMELMHDGWNAPIKIWAKHVSELTEQGAPAKCAKLSVKHLNIRLCLVSASVQVG